VVEVCRQAGITEQTYYRWKKQYASSMSAVAGLYSSSVVSLRDENVRIFAFIFGLLWKRVSRGWNPAVTLHQYQSCQCGIPAVLAVYIFRVNL
jgi:hypothetical protein